MIQPSKVAAEDTADVGEEQGRGTLEDGGASAIDLLLSGGGGVLGSPFGSR